MTASHGTLRNALRVSVLVVVGLVVGCLLVEAGFRVAGWARRVDHRLYLQELKNTNRMPLEIWAPKGSGPWTTTAERAYQHYPPLRPNAKVLATTSDFSQIYQINAKGLRDREYEYEKPAGVTRILAFGDSYTFGSGVAQGECLTEVAERALDGVEILNMGVPGYGLDQILLSFLAQGITYRPDVVLVLLNRHVTTRHLTGIVDGDTVRIPDRLDGVQFTGETGGTVYAAPDDPLWAHHTWLVRHSHALAFLTYRLQVRQLLKALQAEDERFWRRLRAINQAARLEEDPDALRRQRTLALLRELRRVVEASGARFLVVNIDAQYAMAFVRGLPGIDFVDVAPELDARSKETKLTFDYDQHYNAETHRFIGQRLAEELPRRLGRAR